MSIGIFSMMTTQIQIIFSSSGQEQNILLVQTVLVRLLQTFLIKFMKVNCDFSTLTTQYYYHFKFNIAISDD